MITIKSKLIHTFTIILLLSLSLEASFTCSESSNLEYKLKKLVSNKWSNTPHYLGNNMQVEVYSPYKVGNTTADKVYLYFT